MESATVSPSSPAADAPRTGDTIDVLDPATGERVGTIPAGDEADADAAVRCARGAQGAWARTPAAERAAVLKEAVARVRPHVDEIAELQTRENGRPLAESRAGVEAGLASIEEYAALGPLHRGRALQGALGATDLMVHEPRGVCGLLVPWNDPVAIACGQLAACLVAGNTVVLKPSEKTPLSTHRLVELLDLPDGLLTLLLGDGRVGHALAAHPDVDLVIHTGAVATGRDIAATCAPHLRKALLELGGKDALVVDEDVDARWAAGQAAAGAFANAGQLCTSVERIYCHEAVAEAFVETLCEIAGGLRLGHGLDPETDMGPLIDARQREIVARHVEEARAAGAEVLTGGAIRDGAGFFYEPTVLTVPDDALAIMQEETFGPVAAVHVVPSFETALELADGTEYGLAATVLTASQAHAQEAWRRLRVGTVKVNAVWGGAPGAAAHPHGASGTGFGSGPELLDEVTRVKVVHLESAVAAPPTASPSPERDR